MHILGPAAKVHSHHRAQRTNGLFVAGIGEQCLSYYPKLEIGFIGEQLRRMQKIQMSLLRGDSSQETNAQRAPLRSARTEAAISDAVVNNADAMLTDRGSNRPRGEFRACQSRGPGAP